jgi:hypothetical protein
MSEEPKRRLADRLGMSPTVISESTTIVGDIETKDRPRSRDTFAATARSAAP